MKTRRTRWSRSAAALLAIGLVAAACGDDGGSSTPAATTPTATSAGGAATTAGGAVDLTKVKINDSAANGITSSEIKIGWMGDLTGPTASSQSFNMHGTKAYFDCLNEKGGIGGRKINFLPEDDKFVLDNAKVNFTKLVDDQKILAFAGMGNSAITEGLIKDGSIEKAGAVIVGPPQTIDAQTDNKFFFNNLAHYGDQGDIAWEQIKKDVGGAANAKVVGISLEVPSGKEFAAYVKKKVTDGGGRYMGTIFIAGTAQKADSQMVQLKQFVEQGANYITLHGSPASNKVIFQGMSDTKDAKITKLPAVGIHGVATLSLFQEGPADIMPNVAGMHSFLGVNSPEVKVAADMKRCATKAGYKEDESLILNFAHGYLNGYLIEQGIVRAAQKNNGSVTRETFGNAMRDKFDTLGISCSSIDWSKKQHSPCGAAFKYDTATKGLKPISSIDSYTAGFKAVYGIDQNAF